MITAVRVGTYRGPQGELVRVRIDLSGSERCDVERADGSVRPGCATCDCGVLLSDDPDWPWRDLRHAPSLLFVD